LVKKISGKEGRFQQEMAEIEVSSELCYETFGRTDMLLKIAVMNTQAQTIKTEEIRIDPHLNFLELDRKPGENRLIRLSLQTDTQFVISYKATVDLKLNLEKPKDLRETDISMLPEYVFKYLNPSRYCESEELTRLALDTFGDMPKGYLRVQQVSDWVNNHLSYIPGSSNSSTTAQQAMLNKKGVCRDYAHLAISLCRSLGIPARYLSGYAVNLQPPDFHGFFEVYLDGAWYLFDPTRLASTDKLIRIATGLDAAETAFNTIFGSANLLYMNVLAVDLSNQDKSQEQFVNSNQLAVSTMK